MLYEKSCGAVVVQWNPAPQVLMIQQVQGHWCFPKGHMEKDETEQATAIREVQEETGILIQITSSFQYALSYSPAANIHKDLVYFIGTVMGGKMKAQPEEVQEIRWVAIDKALELLTFDSDRKLLEAVREEIKIHSEDHPN